MTLDPHPADVIALLKDRSLSTRIAVVGASNDPAKYGNVIVRNLAGKGYAVLPVNPKEKEIAGLPAFPSLREVPGPVSLVVLVTPPGITAQVLPVAASLGLPAVWLQDGSFDDSVLAYVAQAPFRTVHHACVMVMSNTVT